MDLILRFPLRYLLPALIAGFAILIGVFSYLTTKPLVLKSVEDQAVAEIETQLRQAQGTLQVFLGGGNLEGARGMVASYGTVAGHECMLLTDPDGKVLASSKSTAVGEHWRDMEQPLDAAYVARLAMTGGPEVGLLQEGRRIVGYISVCGAAGDPSQRPDTCGFLYYQRNIGARKEAAVGALYGQAARTGLGIAVLGLILWLLLHYVLTKRFERLARTAERVTSGDLGARARIEGGDELARVGATFDGMLDQVVGDQQALKASEAQAKAVLTTAVDGIITIDVSGVVQTFNGAAERIFGYRSDEVIGHNVKLLMPAPYRGEHDGYLENYLRTGEKKIIGIGREVMGLRKDGTTFPMELAVSDVVLGGTRSFTGIVRDISVRRRAEERATRVGRILEESLNEIYIFDAETLRFIQVNHGAQENLGYSMDELRRLTPLDLKPDFTAESFAKLIEPLRSGERDKIKFSTTHRRKDGSLYPVGVQLQRSAFEAAPVYIAIMLDVSEREQAEQEARRHLDELAHASRLSVMGEMIFGIAHELNQPLAAIMSFSEASLSMLNSGDLKSEMLRNALQQVVTQDERAGEIVRRLRQFVRKGEVQRGPVDINDVVRDVLGFVDHHARLHGVEVKLELDDRLPLVAADKIQIEQVVLNLMRNAIEAMDDDRAPDKTLTVRTARVANEGVEIVVSDTGYGLPTDTPEQIFDAFFTTKSQGMGMGLSISRSIAQAHGGRLRAAANPDGGATFRFTLPTGEAKSDAA